MRFHEPGWLWSGIPSISAGSVAVVGGSASAKTA